MGPSWSGTNIIAALGEETLRREDTRWGASEESVELHGKVAEHAVCGPIDGCAAEPALGRR